MFTDILSHGRDLSWRLRAPAPINANLKDVWLVVTPIWAVLAVGRVVFYALERLRFPADVPPVIADAVQSLVLWPLIVLGCYLTLCTWRRSDLARAAGVLVLTSLALGLLARPAYAIGSLLNSSDTAARMWLNAFEAASVGSRQAWYSWLSNTVEYGVLYLSCAATAMGYFSFMGLTEMRAMADQERLRTLRAQLNPHFLFNSLNALVTLSDSQPAAQTLVIQLSTLLRKTLKASEQDEHELADELAYAEEYLKIEQTRRPKLEWRTRIDSGCSRATVPSLILFPLVENAVTHGLRGGAGQVTIELTARRVRDRLIVDIVNTCRAHSVALDSRGSGLGLRNVRDRLDVLFGRNATLAERRLDHGRFAVQMCLPLKETRTFASRAEGPTCVS
jgi:hypothetical protein